MTYFDEYGYEIVDEAISEETAKLLEIAIDMHRDVYYFMNRLPMDEIGHHNDIMVDKCFGDYGIMAAESLLQLMLPTVEYVTDKKLYPSYTYSRIYYEGAEMKIHKDRPSCEYSATMTISIDEKPWDIWIEDLKGNRESVSLPVGSMMIYQGTKCRHWRDTYTGKKQIQVFLHYVDANGKYYNEMYDGRAMLGAPQLRSSPYLDLSCNSN